MTEAFSERQRRLSLLALNACVFGVGIAFGALVPLITLRLEHQGVDATLIGLNAAMFPLAVLTVGPFLPHLLHRLGALRAMCWGLGVVTVAILLYPMFTSLPAWFALRFLTGAAGAIPWVVSETWLNMVASDRDRGRIMGIYATVLAAGFAIGPALIGVVGVDGWRPFLIVAAAVGVSVIPLGFAGGLAPTMPERPQAPLSDIVRRQPVIMIGAICGGLMDFALYALLPVYGLRHGLDQPAAVLMLSVFTGGNVLLQIPIGWLADRTGRPAVMIACILLSLAGALALPFAIATPALLYVLMFVWGGALFAIYTVGLGLLGDGFPRGQLAAANVVFVMVYQIGGACGPTLAGTAIDLLGPEGLVAVVASVATVLASAFLMFKPGGRRENL
jgi:MFS family permease